MLSNARTAFQLSKDSQWLDILIRSVKEPVINGIEMPRFPHGAVQRQFVGSADEAAMREGFKFYSECKAYFAKRRLSLGPGSTFLDFGCGWGRYTRIFWNDFAWNNIHGVDIDPDILAVCRALRVPGSYTRIDPRGLLPFADNTFDFISAYSVFSHLPEEIAARWMSELSRVTKPGGMMAFTTEPRRFLDFVEKLESNADSGWHATLVKHKPEIPRLRKAFDEGAFVYIPTGGGAHRDADVYGEACISKAYFSSRWSDLFELVDYVDDPLRFWQAFVIVQKPT